MKKIIFMVIFIAIILGCSREENPNIDTNNDNPINTKLDTIKVDVADYSYFHYIRSKAYSANLLVGKKTINDNQIISRILMKFDLSFIANDSATVISAEFNMKKTSDLYNGSLDFYVVNTEWEDTEASWEYANLTDKVEWNNGAGCLGENDEMLWEVEMSDFADTDVIRLDTTAIPNLINYIYQASSDSVYSFGFLIDSPNANELYEFESSEAGNYPYMEIKYITLNSDDTLTSKISPKYDTYIITMEPGISIDTETNLNSEKFSVMSGYVTRSLLKFNFSSDDTLWNIPQPYELSDIIVNNAILHIYIDSTKTNIFNDDKVDIVGYLITNNDWADSMEYNYFLSSEKKEIASSDSAEILINVKKLVTHWLLYPDKNHGMMLRMYSEITTFTELNFIADDAHLPYIELIYSVPPELFPDSLKNNIKTKKGIKK